MTAETNKMTAATDEKAARNPAKVNKGLFLDLMNEADCMATWLENVQSCLQLLEEGLDEEVEFLRKSGDCYAKQFVCRYDLFYGVLEMTGTYLHDRRKAFDARRDELWEAYKRQ